MKVRASLVTPSLDIDQPEVEDTGTIAAASQLSQSEVQTARRPREAGRLSADLVRVGTAEITPSTTVEVMAAPPIKNDPRASMPALSVFYSPGYRPADGIGNHVMPIMKFDYLAQAIQSSGLPVRMREPAPIPTADVLRVHSEEYVNAIRTGEPRDLAESNAFPWSPTLFESVRLTSGGEYAAAKEALENGEFAFALVSGFHHAGPDQGDGYCTFNGLAITAKKLISDGDADRVLIVDNDFHYGNGTAHATADDDNIFTYSVYGHGWDLRPQTATNIRKALPDGTDLNDFLAAQADLPGIIERFKPDIILYQAGMDPLKTDLLSRGYFDLSHGDLKHRDRHVFTTAKRANVPVVANLAGGYSRDVYGEPSPVVIGHLNTYLAALEVFRGYRTELVVPNHARA